MPEYRILALDGGGVRGAFTSRLVERLESATEFLGETDLVAGTSTGGIIALALGAGLSPARIADLYLQRAGDIFSSSIFRKLQGGTVCAKYADDGRRQALNAVLGELKLGDLRSHTVLIPTFDLDSESTVEPRAWKPKFFHNLNNKDGQGDRRERAVDVAMRTSAAPIYFPTSDNYIDGGVAANNPAMAALALATNPDTDSGAGRTLLDIRLLSLGTGINAKWIPGDHDWGLLEWGKTLVNILIDGTMGVATYQCKAMLGPNFHRLNPVLRDDVDLDDADRVHELVEWADKESLEKTISWIKGTYLARPAPAAKVVA
jgi:uncharacterized protein